MDRSTLPEHDPSNVLMDIMAVLNSNRTLSETLDFVVMRAVQALGADAAIIYGLTPASSTAALQAAYGLPPAYLTPTVPYVRGRERSLDQTLLRREAFPVPDLPTNVRLALASGSLRPAPGEEIWLTICDHFASALAIPLTTSTGHFGGLTIYYRERQDFAEPELRLALAIGNQMALAVENARLRATTAESAAAAERGRLARELHDAVTQTLFSASLIADVLPRLWQRDPALVPPRLDQLRRLIRGAHAEMRTLLVELRPAALVEAPLGELLRQLVDAATGQSGIQVTLQVTGGRALPPDAQIALYRIAQEALNNVAKHSGAERAEVRLSFNAESVDLCVRDDGRGFDPSLVPANHLGLSIIRERARAVGMAASLTSRPGEGTTVSVCWMPALRA